MRLPRCCEKTQSPESILKFQNLKISTHKKHQNYFLNIENIHHFCATSVNPFRLSQENVAAFTKSFHATLHPQIYTFDSIIYFRSARFLFILFSFRISNCARLKGIKRTRHMNETNNNKKSEKLYLKSLFFIAMLNDRIIDNFSKVRRR